LDRQANPFISLELKLSEVEKTAEQNAQIDNLIGVINSERRDRGKAPKLLNHNFVHFFASGAWQQERPNGGGYYDSIVQVINMCEPENKLGFLNLVAHELFHADSFNALKTDNDRSVQPYRTGFQFSKDAKPYFLAINEAITEIRARELMAKELKSNPFYADVLRETQAIKAEGLAKAVYLLKNSISGQQVFGADGALAASFNRRGNILLAGDAYREERQTLVRLCDVLAKKNHSTREKVLAQFMSAAKDGNYLPVARVVENTFGRGSFRELGRVSQSGVGFENWVKVKELEARSEVEKFFDKIRQMWKGELKDHNS
jgi:hypothetical protein